MVGYWLGLALPMDVIVTDVIRFHERFSKWAPRVPDGNVHVITILLSKSRKKKHNIK
jgi:hypothetical protein